MGFQYPHHTKLRILVRLASFASCCGKIAKMEQFKQVIDSSAHILAPWSAGPCAASEILLAEELRSEKTVEGEHWYTHVVAVEVGSSELRGTSSKAVKLNSSKVAVGEMAELVFSLSVASFLSYPSIVNSLLYRLQWLSGRSGIYNDFFSILQGNN